MTRLVACVLALTISTGCAGIADPAPDGNDPDLLLGGLWTLVGSSSHSSPTLPVRTKLTVTFTPDGRLGGSAGPNGYGGVYDASATGEIQVDSVGMTLIGGPEAERAALYLADLLRAKRFAVDSTVLYLYHGDNDYLRFVRAR